MDHDCGGWRSMICGGGRGLAAPLFAGPRRTAGHVVLASCMAAGRCGGRKSMICIGSDGLVRAALPPSCRSSTGGCGTRGGAVAGTNRAVPWRAALHAAKDKNNVKKKKKKKKKKKQNIKIH
eukprot:NODE_8884_length_1463_cov_3.089820.p3 GENE.NODE_8884_length_1463_cov_3.089820~~NODE_8884_length_1463_cov_3.089820.p3  ORF type:complete len:122 (-),score=30.85 NODE_8884_length_1463_cov_3.089820:124-489(-)